MMKFVLKGCPRCGGDLMPERYLLSESLTCIQCGYEILLPAEAPLASNQCMPNQINQTSSAAHREPVAVG